MILISNILIIGIIFLFIELIGLIKCIELLLGIILLCNNHIIIGIILILISIFSSKNNCK